MANTFTKEMLFDLSLCPKIEDFIIDLRILKKKSRGCHRPKLLFLSSPVYIISVMKESAWANDLQVPWWECMDMPEIKSCVRSFKNLNTGIYNCILYVK